MAEQPAGKPHLAAGHLAHKVDGQKHHLPHKEKVVVQQVQRHQRRKGAAALFVEGTVQRPQKVRKQGHHIQKVVEENVVDGKTRKPIQAARHHGVVRVAHIAPGPQVTARTRHSHFQAEHGGHEPGQRPGREQQGEPPEGRTGEVKGIAVPEIAAQVRGPAEGATPAFHKLVGIVIKWNLLAVKIACIVKNALVHQHAGQQKAGRPGKAQPKGKPEFVLRPAAQSKFAAEHPVFHECSLSFQRPSAPVRERKPLLYPSGFSRYTCSISRSMSSKWASSQQARRRPAAPRRPCI